MFGMPLDSNVPPALFDYLPCFFFHELHELSWSSNTCFIVGTWIPLLVSSVCICRLWLLLLSVVVVRGEKSCFGDSGRSQSCVNDLELMMVIHDGRATHSGCEAAASCQIFCNSLDLQAVVYGALATHLRCFLGYAACRLRRRRASVLWIGMVTPMFP